MSISRRGFLLGGLGAAAAVGAGAGAWALDRYVVDHVEVTNASSIAAPQATVAADGTAQVSIDTVTGIVVRNGVAFRDSGARQGLAFYADGTVRLYDETTTSAAALVEQGVWNTLSFGPGLVDNGAIIDGIDDVEVDTNFGNHSVQGNQPRTGVGFVDTNHLLFIVVDGRSSGYSKGVTMTEFARIFVDRGAKVAYNLDGGGSSTMVYQNRLVNNPLGKGQERGTSDILYVVGSA